MNWEEFLWGLKGNNKELLDKLENLRINLGLNKLYLIYINHEEAAWGLRALEINEQAVREKLQEFLKENVYLGGEFSVVVLENELKEVEYVLGRAGLQCEILDVNENTGEIILNINPDKQKPAEHILIHLLPWVKKVSADDSINKDSALISVTDKAAKKIKSILQEKSVPESGGLRFGIIAGGCSGYQHEIKPEMRPEENDEILEKDFEENGVKYTIRIFVSQASLPYLKGAVIDWGWVDDLMSEGFIIINPNKKGSCGCGKSVDF